MSQIYISYRRNDAAGHAGRLYNQLCNYFRAEDIFFDHVNITSEDPFNMQIEEVIHRAKVVLVVIGPEWLKEIQMRRYHDHDVVRHELSVVLSLFASVKMPLIIPVLCGGASMPQATQLPDEIRALCDIKAHIIAESSYKQAVSRLFDHLKAIGLSPVTHTRHDERPIIYTKEQNTFQDSDTTIISTDTKNRETIKQSAEGHRHLEALPKHDPNSHAGESWADHSDAFANMPNMTSILGDRADFDAMTKSLNEQDLYMKLGKGLTDPDHSDNLANMYKTTSLFGGRADLKAMTKTFHDQEFTLERIKSLIDTGLTDSLAELPNVASILKDRGYVDAAAKTLHDLELAQERFQDLIGTGLVDHRANENSMTSILTDKGKADAVNAFFRKQESNLAHIKGIIDLSLVDNLTSETHLASIFGESVNKATETLHDQEWTLQRIHENGPPDIGTALANALAAKDISGFKEVTHAFSEFGENLKRMKGLIGLDNGNISGQGSNASSTINDTCDIATSNTEISKEPDAKRTGQKIIAFDPFLLAYRLVLERIAPIELLAKPDANSLLEAITKMQPGKQGVERLTNIWQTLEAKHGDAPPNPLWYAWAQTVYDKDSEVLLQRVVSS